MSLLQTIKADQLTARKARQALNAALLTTLIGEAELVGKNNGNRAPTDDEVMATIKKFIKNNETIQGAHRLPSHDAEITILKAYLPQQLTEAQLKELIDSTIALADKKPTVGELMSKLKTNFGGQYDGALASRLIKAALA